MTTEPQSLLFEHNEAEHWYKLDGQSIVSVTDVISDNRLLDTAFLTAIGRYRGSMVHDAVKLDLESELEGAEYELDEASLDAVDYFQPGELMSFVRGARKFVEDFQFKPTLIEWPTYHPIHRYGMRIDAAGPGQLRGREKQLLVDWTLSTGLEIKRIQTAAYVYGLPKPHEWVRIGVKLKPDGYKHKVFEIVDLKRDMDDFLAGLRMTRLRAETFGVNGGSKWKQTD